MENKKLKKESTKEKKNHDGTRNETFHQLLNIFCSLTDTGEKICS